MKKELDGAIVQYCVSARKYEGCSRYKIDTLMHNLDWQAFQIAAYLALPEKDEQDRFRGPAKEFLENFYRILLYYNVEMENADTENMRKVVRITGYEEHPGEKPQSCFSMLCLLVYSFIVEEKEKERFLECMLIAPCCSKIEREFLGEEDKTEIKKAFELTDRYGRSLEIHPEEKRGEFRRLYKKYYLDEYLPKEDYSNWMIEMESGYGAMSSVGSRRGSDV